MIFSVKTQKIKKEACYVQYILYIINTKTNKHV